MSSVARRLEATANVEPPIYLYKLEIRDTEIIFGNACVEEYIPLGTPSPSTPSSRATIETQHNNIQHPHHKTQADLECLRQTAPSQGQRSVQGAAEIRVYAIDEQMMDKNQHGGVVQMNKAQEGHVRPGNGEPEMLDQLKIKRKKIKEFINQMSPNRLRQLIQNLNDKQKEGI
ncbi:hypothetical protein Cgig2_014532 [Carnegiea gigantea]|uniref:Uncharacterized protein n=1 Tax=Carnegiea gigantea TaxID=171969 RepID=A0A9Q1GN19_9CARY|nr:hypothetical protein Cgig2_014532 [Carnegiea gigantea]